MLSSNLSLLLTNCSSISLIYFSGSVQSNVWDSLVPSKKRAFLACPKASSIEKLRKDLYSILHEEQASNMSRTSEDDNLLYESGIPFDSSEIGYGGILIKHPYPKSVEEESEASSFSVDKLKTIKEGYSSSTSFPVNSVDKGASCTKSGMDTMKSTSQVSRDTDDRYFLKVSLIDIERLTYY